MATSKESIVICLDVSPGMRIKSCPNDPRTPLQIAVECIQWILQRRIFSESKDEIGMVIFGSETNNPLFKGDQYRNVSIFRELEVVDWDFVKLLDEIPSESVDADFLDALVVALDVLYKGSFGKKFSQKSVVLFSNLNCSICDDQLTKIICAMKTIGVDFAAIGPMFNDDSSEDDEKYKFSKQQLIGENIVQQIVEAVDGTCLSLNQALPLLSYFSRRQANPTAWKCMLEIGLDLHLPICMYVKTKENKIKQSWKYMNAQDESANISTVKSIERPSEDVVKFAKNGHNGMEIKNEARSATNGDSGATDVEEDAVETVKAFKYGTTLVPLDQLDVEAVRYKNDGKSFRIMAFVPKHTAKFYYFMGDGAHVVLPDANDQLACTAFSALLKSMQESKVYALVRYAYNVRSSPKVGALIPEIDSNGVEYLVFVTLPFSDDCRFYPFASLNLEILKPRDEQIVAMDAFIDGLNLNRGNLSGNAFSPLEAVNPHIQYVFRCLLHRQMYPNDPLPQPEAEISSSISPNNQLFDSLKPIINNLKNCFKLEKVQKVDKRAAANVFSTTDDQAPYEKVIKLDEKGTADTVASVKISTVRPVEDFKEITETTPEAFEEATNQLGDIIGQFIFESMGCQLYGKALECVTCYRNACIKVSKPGYYNRFISTFKTSLLSKNKIAFWNTVCESGQGLICDNECSSSQVSGREANEFLQKEETKVIDEKPAAEPEPSQDDLLNELE